MKARDAAEMRELGVRIAGLLGPGDLVVLTGSLGAGKTTLTQGIGEGLNVRGPITSPTFVIARVHPPLADGPALVHVDAYRLGGALEVDDLDLDASIADSITIVEWGEGLVEDLSDERLEILIESGTEDDQRIVHVRGVGRRWSDIPAMLI
ncbi:tRNA threonylcarbamoyladenosine biosynthesis protein TsaE [Acrocarpospora corrugata]|uniref:tRNA threonylcarbamoyladenosine biosynthesis protein TsaE n=1 Tax=Acrocarpospora corrugata TaxID=35763 RepID=A0A5M3VVD0_9ACTN|nr:tRNA (adenosine(37)-N6)-threonylcarbamoyltransferase complex ATPase subunit type 1 TsaE [Acrocarpospora corrugata]GES00464.1 tRNA threonylcarbamoyladenosine biosynthesis protein TsaE [Acrocarpospora corrugata]